jgi:hypothetical protein
MSAQSDVESELAALKGRTTPAINAAETPADPPAETVVEDSQVEKGQQS